MQEYKEHTSPWEVIYIYKNENIVTTIPEFMDFFQWKIEYKIFGIETYGANVQKLEIMQQVKYKQYNEYL